ncbi:MAG: prenyltransferase/squalene oxidase repeat-containing protein, partial [Candidatus Thorarchaeota archaeon]
TFSAALKFDRDVDMKRVKVITIAFAFMLVLVAASAQPVAAASRSDSLRSYISGRFDVERGGYSPPSDDVVRVDATYGAILALDELGSIITRPPPVNLTAVLDSLVIRQWNVDATENDNETGIEFERYGGFSEYLLGPVTMDMNMMAITLYDILKSQSDYPGIAILDINQDDLLTHLNRTQTESGGFSRIPGYTPDIVSTYQALYLIEYLSLHDIPTAWNILANETATLEWINDCRVGDGFKLSPISDTMGVTATSAGIMALDLLPSVTAPAGLQDAISWVQERQIVDAVDDLFIGGFEEGVETGDPNMKSTRYALTLLDSYGALEAVNDTTAVDFIRNCQTEDGSWGYIPGASLGNLVYAGQACELLNLFGSAASILAASEDPYSPGGFTLDWRYIVLVGIIIVALVIAIISVRRD